MHLADFLRRRKQLVDTRKAEKLRHHSANQPELLRDIDTMIVTLNRRINKLDGQIKAARRFVSRLATQFGEPRVVVTDKLRSYTKPIQNLAPVANYRAHKGLNNRIEN